MSQVKDLLQKGAQKAYEEAQVPLKHHLLVVKALQKAMADHQADMHIVRVLANRHATQLNEHDAKTDEERRAHAEQLARIDAEIQRLTSIERLKGDPGEPGLPGKNAPSLEEIIAAVIPYIPEPIKGDPGKDAAFDKDAFMKELVDYLRKEKPLDVSHIRNAQTFIKDGVRYRVEELMHGGGSSGTSALSVIAVSGTIDDSNTTFTTAAQPTLLNINGAFYQPTGGAITWVYNSGIITTSSAVGSGGSIFGI